MNGTATAAHTSALRPLRLPHLSRMLLLPAVAAHVFALVGLVENWSRYRPPGAAATLFVLSCAMPAVLVLAPRRDDGVLPVPAAATVVGGVFTVSVLLPAILPDQEWASWAAWNWTTGAMTLLGLAVYLPPARIAGLAAAHGVLAVSLILLGAGGWWNAQLALVAAVIAPLAAAQYLRFYEDALAERADAVAVRARADAGPDAGPDPWPDAGPGRAPDDAPDDADVLRLGDDPRLASLRDRIEPLLRDIAEGGTLPLDNARAAAARELATQLREALAASRRALWLPAEIGGAAVSVVATDGATRVASDADRVWLAALLDLLGQHRTWARVRLVLDLRLNGSLSAVVTADGPAARVAAADARVRALCADRSARCDADDGLLVVEAELSTKIGA